MASPIELLLNWALDEGIELDVDQASQLLEEKTVEDAWALLTGLEESEDEESSSEDPHEYFIPAICGLIDLVTDAKSETKPMKKRIEFHEEMTTVCVIPSILRQCVAQNGMPICGAASTAGAINAVHEGIRKLPLTSWDDILFNHFRDRMNINVVKKGNILTTKRVGNRHILQVKHFSGNNEFVLTVLKFP